MEQMFSAFPPDAAGNLDYKNLVYIITHGEEKDQEWNISLQQLSFKHHDFLRCSSAYMVQKHCPVLYNLSFPEKNWTIKPNENEMHVLLELALWFLEVIMIHSA